MQERCPRGRRGTIGNRVSRKGPWVRIPLSPPEDVRGNIDSWVLRNGNLRTPSGPEGSSGSKNFRVPQGSLAINIY